MVHTSKSKSKIIEEKVEQLVSFAKLEKDWYGYSSDPIPTKCISNAINYFYRVNWRQDYIPHAIWPTAIPSVTFEWHKGPENIRGQSDLYMIINFDIDKYGVCIMDKDDVIEEKDYTDYNEVRSRMIWFLEYLYKPIPEIEEELKWYEVSGGKKGDMCTESENRLKNYIEREKLLPHIIKVRKKLLSYKGKRNLEIKLTCDPENGERQLWINYAYREEYETKAEFKDLFDRESNEDSRFGEDWYYDFARSINWAINIGSYYPIRNKKLPFPKGGQ